MALEGMDQLKIDLKEYFADLQQKLYQPVSLEVGWDKDTIYPDDAATPVYKVAQANEFGTVSKKGNPHIPARPFMRITIQKNKNKWIELLQNWIASGLSIDNALNKLGYVILGDIKKTINSNIGPKNKNPAKRKKGEAEKVTLIDTHVMINSIRAQVINE